MSIPPDLEIARGARLRPLTDVAADMGVGEHLLQPYGRGVAKISLDALEELDDRPRARYVLVSAVTPTPLGEGKTTTTVGLGQALRAIGRNAAIAIRQPSMGPTFGIKGGAAGGGYSQVVPMDILNLHLTGDMHAVTAAHNLLAAMVDNHVHQHDDFFAIDRHSITWRRVLDVNDRALRNIIVGLGARADGVIRETGFDITAASEVMAVLALSTSLQDMRQRMGRIVVGRTTDGEPVTAEQLRAAGAMTVIMRDAIKPNLMQTLEGTPVLVHAGPFGNIAHGNSSVVADQVAVRGVDYVVTEAGFGADMGAERFFNIKCRTSGLVPDAAVLVATVRALKAHSGRFRIVAGRPLPEELLRENPDDVRAGADNLRKQVENIRLHGVSPVVAINAFPTDHESEHDEIRAIAEELGVRAVVSTHFAKGVRARPTSPRRWSRRVRSRASSGCSTTTTRPSARRSTPSPRACTGPMVSSTTSPRPGSWRPSNRPATATCPSSSPRPTCRSAPTRRCWAHRPAGRCRCARSVRRSVPASSTCCAVTCAPCRDCPGAPPQSASTSTSAARSSGCPDVRSPADPRQR